MLDDRGEDAIHGAAAGIIAGADVSRMAGDAFSHLGAAHLTAASVPLLVGLEDERAPGLINF